MLSASEWEMLWNWCETYWSSRKLKGTFCYRKTRWVEGTYLTW